MIHFATFSNVKDAKNGHLHKITVAECISKYLSKHVLATDNGGPCFTLAHYHNTWIDDKGHERVHRKKDNISGMYGTVFDIDNDENHETMFVKDAVNIFKDYTYSIYTTFSNMVDTRFPRFRVVLFFDRMATIEEHDKVWTNLRGLISPNINVDRGVFDWSHAWGKPAHHNSRTSFSVVKTQEKKLICVDEIIKEADLASVLYINRPDQRFALTRDTEARSESTYSILSSDVNRKITNNNINYDIEKPLQNLTTSLTDDVDLLTRVERVLADPAMHVSNFTGADYLEWVRIGSAIKGAGLPFSVFDNWCQGDAEKYNEAGRSTGLLKRWHGFNGAATEGTIFNLAKERGVAHYLGFEAKRDTLRLVTSHATVKKAEPEPEPEIDEPIEEYKPRPKDNKLRAFPIELCNKAPENIAMYMDYVMSTNTHPHPVFALANAISTLGSLYHQRVQAKYKRCCPNMYILTLALAGQGKAHAFNCTRELYRKLGLVHNIANIPASTAGLITGLRIREGNMYMLVDEFEKKFLRMLTSKAAASHFMQVSGELMNIYTIPHEPYIGEMMYADADKNSKAPIPNPHLSIYGACIDDDFYKHYAGEGAEDGFLARIMPFINKDYYPQVNDRYKDIEEIPEKLLNFCQNIIKDPIIKLDASLDMSIKPKIIDFDCDATRRYHGACVEEWRDRTWKEGLNGNKKVASLYSRLCENALKIALAAHSGGVITRDVWQWSLDVSVALVEISINNAISKVSDNKYVSKVNQMEDLITKHGGWITKKEITLKFRDELRVRDDILEYLIEAGKIVQRKTIKGKARKYTTEYMAI